MRFVKAFVAFAMIMTSVFSSVGVKAAQEQAPITYELYPTPHSLEYKNSNTTLSKEINVVYEAGIDADTKARLVEVFAQKQVTVKESSALDTSKTTVLLGISGSKGYVDTYVKEHITVKDANLFTKSDASVMHVENNVITVLGKDSDSVFYALTSLYHIVNQMSDLQMRDFHMEDYADIVSRGFIEGYYGNPWSTQDRINLMTWGGYYKLNSYFYAPKDDPKHNRNWRELYTETEIAEKIAPLAEAGNKSKCRFVYALHPYMHNAIATDTNSAQYQADLKTMQAKFAQVIKAGVRQIAILADDAGNKGGPHYIKMLQDMTAWIQEQQKTYPDLKLTLPFCVQEYMSNGHSYYRQFPDNVQIIMTGGKVWGEVSPSFTNTFTNNAGRGPYMWINWPCSDNSKKHLIMGGYKDFLQTGVDASKIEGIVLNPMQQSEPSKVAIFGNACYSWNMWETNEEADRAWEASFDYVDHNNAHSTDASIALKELSKHMINQNMDGRVRVLQESVVLKEKLNPLKEKLKTNTLSSGDVVAIDALIQEFTALQTAAKTYREQAGNKNTRDQIVYWLNCWDDTTVAAITYLNALKAVINNDQAMLVDLALAADDAFAKSKSHGFHYVDHIEYAEVGVQHIVPFIKEMQKYTSTKMKESLDPDYVGKQFITNRTDTPEGDEANVFDGSDATKVIFKTPNSISANDYFGVMYTKEIPIHDIRILQGDGKDHFDYSKLQYTKDGKTWVDFEFVNKQNAFTAVEGQALEIVIKPEHMPKDFTAKGIRLFATQNNRKDAWLQICEIAINKQVETSQPVKYNVIRTNRWHVSGGSEANLHDGNDTSFVYYDPDGPQNSTQDDFMVNDFLGYDLGSVMNLKSTHIVVGNNAKAGDKIVKYAIETSVDNQTWTPVKGYENYVGKSSGVDTLDIDLNGISARYIRIRVTEQRGAWGYFSEFSVVKQDDSQGVIQSGNKEVTTYKNAGEMGLNPTNVTLNKEEYVGVQLDRIYSVKVDCPNKTSDLVVETSLNGIEWHAYKAGADAAYVRVRSTKANTTLNTEGFKVTYETGNKAVESNMGLNSANEDVRRNPAALQAIFDGNLTTHGKVTGIQEAGKYVTFDYGRVIDVTNMRYYIMETSVDYLRHAKIEVSADNKTWKEAMVIGDANFDTNNMTPAKEHKSYVHDSKNPGNVYVEAKDLNTKVRYVKITPLTTYSQRWIQIGEIQFNDGAYISPDLSRDIIADSVEVEGHIPSNAIDRNALTSYKPSAKKGTIVYRLREPKEAYKAIRIVQKGEISRAQVSVRYANQKDFVNVGTLTGRINEFNFGGHVVEVKFTYDGIAPEIMDMYLLRNEVSVCTHANKEEVVKKAPTCTEKGTVLVRCKACKHEIEVKDVKALGHDLTPTTRVEPTCGEAGKETKKCSRCDHKVEKTLPATGKHTYGEWKVVKEATEQAEGLKERACSGCGHRESAVIEKLPAKPETEKPGTPLIPLEPSTPVEKPNTDKPVIPNVPSKPETKPEQKPNTDGTNTGDVTSMGMVASMLTASGASVLAVLKTRKKD